MGIKSTTRGGAGAGRGDDPHRSLYAKDMGVPEAWATGPGKASFTGSIVGGDGKRMWMSAESTGGGATDTHEIPFAHELKPGAEGLAAFDQQYGVNRENPSAGKKWKAEGTYDYRGKGMTWALSPVDDGTPPIPRGR